MNTENTLQHQIDAKEQEIEHYKGVLQRYQSGRWYDMGLRHLSDLKQELQTLQAQQTQKETAAQ